MANKKESSKRNRKDKSNDELLEEEPRWSLTQECTKGKWKVHIQCTWDIYMYVCWHASVTNDNVWPPGLLKHI